MLEISSIELPNLTKLTNLDNYDSDKQEFTNNNTPSKLKLLQKIPLEGDLNKARYLPQKPDVIACLADSGPVYIMDRTKHPSSASGKMKTEIILSHHDKDSFGISWNVQNEGQLLTASEDKTVALWNLKEWDGNRNVLRPLRVFRSHSKEVNDVEWVKHHDALFVTCSDDLSIQLHDIRKKKDVAQEKANAHTMALNSLSLNPFNEYLLAVGSQDTTISLWDTRRLNTKLFDIVGQGDSLGLLEWSPHESSVLASAGITSNLVMLWDVSKKMDSQTEEETKQGPPELMFIHGGHKQGVTDMSWNPNEAFALATVSYDNTVQVWKPSQSIVGYKSRA